MAHHPPNDNPTHLLFLYNRVASAQTSLSLFAFPPTSHPSPSEIRSAYKTLALALHPDKAPPGREELHTALFQKVHAAFQDLVNPKEATGKPHDAAAEEGGRQRSNVVPLRRIEDSLHARVHDFREWLKMQRSAELERKKGKKGARGGRVSKGDCGHEVFSEGWEDGPDVVVEGKKESVLAGSKACVARSAQKEKKKSRFLEGAGSKVRAEKRLDRLYASRAISTREYERAWMALDDMPEQEDEEEMQGFVDQEPELCEMLGIRASDPPAPPAGTEAGQRLIANAVDAEELSEGVAANLGLLLVEVTPSRSGQKAICRGRKSQPVDSWEEEEDRLAASVSGK